MNHIYHDCNDNCSRRYTDRAQMAVPIPLRANSQANTKRLMEADDRGETQSRDKRTNG